jgi:hypothetical protein
VKVEQFQPDNRNMTMNTQPAGRRLALLASALAVLLASRSAVSQQTRQSSATAVRSTSFADSASRGESQNVGFGRHAPRVGDRVEQTLALEMRLAMSVRQGNQLTGKSQMRMLSEQRRVVTTSEVQAGRTVAVTVQYLEATKQMVVSDGPASDTAIADAKESSHPTAQPVQGKSYHCRREAGDNGKLLVTDERGIVPPTAEYEIVAQNMETIGRTNPLAEFLAGRSVAVGETLKLPRDAADRMFNLSERFGDVTCFDLTLRKTLTVDGAQCAEFLARVEAASTDSSQMRLQVEGPLVVQLETCRAVRTDLSGPLGLSESRGSYSTAHQVIGTGQLSMRIASAYDDAQR